MPLEIEFKHTIDIIRKKIAAILQIGIKTHAQASGGLDFKVIKCTHSETCNLKGVSIWRSLKVKKLFLSGFALVFCIIVMLSYIEPGQNW